MMSHLIPVTMGTGIGTSIMGLDTMLPALTAADVTHNDTAYVCPRITFKNCPLELRDW